MSPLKFQKASIKKQLGLSLIEGMAVLALVSVVAFTVTKRVNSAMLDSKISEAEGDIQALFAAASKFKSVSPTYTGVNCNTLVADRYHDVGWSSCTAVNPWNGNYTVTPNGSNPTSVDITATNVVAAACKRMANSFSKITPATCTGTTLSVTFAN